MEKSRYIKQTLETSYWRNGAIEKMKLQIGRHLYTWDPVSWIHGRFLYGKCKTATLDRTMHWHDVLSDWIDELPDNVPAQDFDTIQELRRDIGHFRIDLMGNKIKKLGHERKKGFEESPEDGTYL